MNLILITMKNVNKVNILRVHLKLKDLLNANPKSNIIPKGKYLVLGDNRESQ